MPDLANLNPLFSSRLDALRAALAKEGIANNVISGYRTPEYQGQMYANHLAKQAGKPLPYPNVEAPKVVAPAWRSFHNYGLAGDFSLPGGNYARLRELAPQFGLSGIGVSDPGHIQLAGGLDQDIAQYKLAGWRPSSQPSPPQGALAYAGPQPAAAGPAVSAINNAAPPPGQQPMNDHSQFIRNYASQIGLNPNVALGVAGAEGLHAWSPNNPNAGSYVDRAGGQPFSFGDFQLNTRNGMGVDALRAGVDPRDPNQWQAADKFAMDRMKTGGLGPWKGDQFARSWGNQPITGGQQMMAQNQQQQQAPPPASSGMFPAGYPGGNPPAAAAAAPQNMGDWIKKVITRPPPTKDDKGNEVQGKSPLEKIAGDLQPPQQQQAAAVSDQPQQSAMLPVQDPTAQMMGPSQQLLTAAIAAGAKPLSWSARPFGYQAGQQMGNDNG